VKLVKLCVCQCSIKNYLLTYLKCVPLADPYACSRLRWSFTALSVAFSGKSNKSADDSSGVALQCALNNLCDWCVEWQMTINANKCCVLALGRSSATSYTINNTLLPVSNVVSDLGVRVDTKLHCVPKNVKPKFKSL